MEQYNPYYRYTCKSFYCPNKFDMKIGKTVGEPLMDKVSKYMHIPTNRLVMTVITNEKWDNIWNAIWVNDITLFTTIITIEPMIE